MSIKLFASLPLDTVIYLLMSRNWLHDFGSPTAQSYEIKVGHFRKSKEIRFVCTESAFNDVTMKIIVWVMKS